ncbi:MAG TPA: hypothetical protein VK900_10695 [Anaerolineales bacterium]|nr:hypothetical protein [Anaerolineales bacterium]
MTGSVNITNLLDWLEGRLTEDKVKAITAAVQADESHEATVNWLRDFLSLSRSTVLIEPPPELLEEAAATFRTFARHKRQDSWLRRLAATLAFDSWQRPSLVGVRRTGLGALPRQLVYRADTADIALNTRTGVAEDVFDLVGQIFPRDESDPASFTVQLLHQNVESALTYTDRVGKFTCTDLIAGAYTIIIRGDQAEITIAGLDLSA